jgi:HSP20 family protein
MRNRDLIPGALPTPFALMRRLTDEMDRIFEDFEVRRPFAFFKPEVRAAEWTPAVELFEKENKLFVRAELPGLKKEDVKIELTDEYLTLQGERKVEKEEKEKGYIRTERFYGTFFRQIPLPEGVKTDLAKAIFKDGILEIEVPVEAKKPIAGRRLPIEEPKEEKEKELVAAR